MEVAVCSRTTFLPGRTSFCLGLCMLPLVERVNSSWSKQSSLSFNLRSTAAIQNNEFIHYLYLLLLLRKMDFLYFYMRPYIGDIESHL
jgi:hypothetical protein